MTTLLIFSTIMMIIQTVHILHCTDAMMHRGNWSSIGWEYSSHGANTSCAKAQLGLKHKGRGWAPKPSYLCSPPDDLDQCSYASFRLILSMHSIWSLLVCCYSMQCLTFCFCPWTLNLCLNGILIPTQ